MIKWSPGRLTALALVLALVTGGAVVAAPAPAMKGRPTCRPAQYRLTLGAQGATQSIVASARIALVGRASCRLHGEVVLRVEDGAGRLVRTVRGDPGQVRLHRVLHAGAPVWAAWAWSNFCPEGERSLRALPPSYFTRRYRFVVVFVAQRAVVRVNPPVCGDPAIPSRLTQAGVGS